VRAIALHRKMERNILVTLIMLFLSSNGYSQPVRIIDSLNEAVRLSEEFVRVQGYTSTEADPSRFRDEFLSSQDERSRTEILAARANTVEPKAYSYERSNDELFQWRLFFAVLPDKPRACVGAFRVIMIWTPHHQYEQKLMVMHDMMQGLPPFTTTTLVEGEERLECKPNQE
jgi:hypothetical protein